VLGLRLRPLAIGGPRQNQIAANRPPRAQAACEGEAAIPRKCSGLTTLAWIASRNRFFSTEPGRILFSSLFSRSSSCSRFASVMSIMSNSRFQRWDDCSERLRYQQTSSGFRPLLASRTLWIFPRPRLACLL